MAANHTASQPDRRDPAHWQRCADKYLGTGAFLSVSTDLTLDLRPLAVEVAAAIRNAGDPRGAATAARAAARQWWAQWEEMQAEPLSPSQQARVRLIRAQFDEQIHASTQPRPEEISPQHQAPRLITRVMALKQLAAASARRVRHALRAEDSDAVHKETELIARMRAVCERYGLHSLRIEGDATSSVRDRADALTRLDKGLAEACRQLGLEERCYGDDGQVQMEIFTSPRRYWGVIQHAGSSRSRAHPKIEANYAHWSLPTILAHEWVHHSDAKAAQQAFERSDVPQAERARLKPAIFSGLPESIRANHPEAAKALKRIFGLVEAPGESPKDDLLNAIDKVILRHILGERTALSLDEGTYRRMALHVGGGDHFLAKRMIMATKHKGAIEGAALQGMLFDADPCHGPVRPARFITEIADTMGVTVQQVTTGLKQAVQAAAPKIRQAYRYVNPMMNHVNNPGEMIRAGGAAKFEYPNLPWEVLARTVGRPRSAAQMLLHRLTGPLWSFEPYTARQIAELNQATAEWIKSTGFRLNATGPDLGFNGEKPLVAAAGVVRVALTGPAQSAAQLAGRLVRHLMQTDAGSRPPGSKIKPP